MMSDYATNIATLSRAARCRQSKEESLSTRCRQEEFVRLAVRGLYSLPPRERVSRGEDKEGEKCVPHTSPRNLLRDFCRSPSRWG